MRNTAWELGIVLAATICVSISGCGDPPCTDTATCEPPPDGGGGQGEAGQEPIGGMGGVGGTVAEGGSDGGSGGMGGTYEGAPSCAPGLLCGGHGCCDTALVPQGSYFMGRSIISTKNDYYPSGLPDELPEHPASVAAFYLDRFEVTVARWRNFVAALPYAPAEDAAQHPLVTNSGWDSTWNTWLPVDATQYSQRAFGGSLTTATWTADPGPNENKPINCVSWYEALAFCIWDGGRLPLEVEWEYASSGGGEERLYPWGQTAPSSLLAAFGCQFDGINGCANEDLPEVHAVPSGIGKYGNEALAGSLYELTRDTYDVDFYSNGGCNSCANLAPAGSKVIRGGSYAHGEMNLRAAHRFYLDGASRAINTGFRCARDSLPD